MTCQRKLFLASMSTNEALLSSYLLKIKITRLIVDAEFKATRTRPADSKIFSLFILETKHSMDKSFEDARLHLIDVDKGVLLHGPKNLPGVHRLLLRIFTDGKIKSQINTDLAVAIGVGVYVYIASGKTG